MVEYVLVSDTTLVREFHDFPLLQFLPCSPVGNIPRPIYEFLKGPPAPHENGRALKAPYALRKLEAALLNKLPPDRVAVAHENYIESFVKPDTRIIGIYTMDPLGLGPLSMSYRVLFGDQGKKDTFVHQEFETLLRRIHAAKKNNGASKAKIMVGGPGVWELTYHPEEVERLGIDYIFQGEVEDVLVELFEQVGNGGPDAGQFFVGYQSFDESFHKLWVPDPEGKFISRKLYGKQFPKLEEIPDIRGATFHGLVEIMRGCGIGCDFCEVTLRPLRYYPTDKILREITVNTAQGCKNAWLQTDEFFAYEHGKNFEPNQEALTELFTAVMSFKGITHTNPTHGRISIPAAYPDLMKRLSEIARAGPDNWIGIQVGVETGSDRLAMIHMPNKTLPLKIGADGHWHEIVFEGTMNLNKNYWRPAFTAQVGQPEEIPEDSWDTVGMVNDMSNAGLEFTITPLINVPLGLLKSNSFHFELEESHLAVIYACYRHLEKMAHRDAYSVSRGNFLKKLALTSVMNIGATVLMKLLEKKFKAQDLNIEKVKRHTLR